MSRSSFRNITESLLILGTALTVYWQPLARQFPPKASDIVLVLALGVWLVSLLREGLPPALRAAGFRIFLPLLALLGSLLAATLVSYLRYDLTMSRGGAILLTRLVLCLALFLATFALAHASAVFRRRISIAFLAPVVLFPLMLVPALPASQWVQGRFQGLTVNPNTADLGFSVALAIASVLAMYEIRSKRGLLALVFAAVAAGMLVLIMWTQSRSYLAGAFASIVLGAVLTAPRGALRKLGAAAVTTLVFLAVVTAGLLLAPHAITRSYIARLSWGTLAPPTSDTQSLGSPGQPTPERMLAPAPAFSGPQTLARSNWVLTRGRPIFASGRYGALDNLERLPNGVLRRLMENPHVQAAVLYAELLPTNYLGLGVNYEEKFFLYFPWINVPHAGTNSILDIPIYGGVGAVLSIGYLMVLVARKTRDRLEKPEETLPYGIGATAAFAGAWVAAVLLGSPIFDYQLWIVTALALA
jgi:hypothetical protein